MKRTFSDMNGHDDNSGTPGGETRATKKAKHCTSWGGHLDPDELIRPGALLLSALVKCASERGQTLTEMAKEVGVTYGYICQLRNGDRKVSSASATFTLGCAIYLGIPHLTALVMAGKLGEKDLYEMNEVPARDLGSAMEVIVSDAKFGTLVTSEIRLGSVQTRYAFVRLIEQIG